MAIIPKQQNVQLNAVSTTTFGSRLRPVRRDAPEIRYRNDIAVGQEKLANAFDTLGTEIKKRTDKSKIDEEQVSLDQWEASNIYDRKAGAYSKRGKDAVGVADSTLANFDKYAEERRKNLFGEEQISAFNTLYGSRRAALQRQLGEYEFKEGEETALLNNKAAIASNLDMVAQAATDPDQVDRYITGAKATALSYARVRGIPDAAMEQQLAEIESKGRLTALKAVADSDPSYAIDFYKTNRARFTADDMLAAQNLMQPVERKFKATGIANSVLMSASPKVEQNDIIRFVMNDLEGGDKVITDSNGAIAKFGINKAANPDLDVANLTPEQAAQRYKTEYWDKIAAGELPPSMRLAALSFAATSGVSAANKLIDEADGDAGKFIQLQAKFYKDLATKNPDKYGQYLEGWMNRLDKVVAATRATNGEIPDEVELLKRISEKSDDPDVISDARTLVKTQLETMRRVKKEQEDAASEEAWNYRNSGQVVPPSVEARMSPKDVAAMRKSAEPDPRVYEDIRNKILTGQAVDLPAMRWSLGDKFDELVKLQQDPEKVANARKVDDVIKSASSILIGRASPKSEDDFKKVEQFRRAVDSEIDALQRKTNKPAGDDDVQRITDKLLLNVERINPYWNDSVRRYEIAPGQAYEAGSIPANRKFYVKRDNGPVEITYDDVIDTLAGRLRKKGMDATDTDNLDAEFELLLNDPKFTAVEQ